MTMLGRERGPRGGCESEQLRSWVNVRNQVVDMVGGGHMAWTLVGSHVALAVVGGHVALAMGSNEAPREFLQGPPVLG